ncbi:PIG-L domain-containing protein [Marivirga lumbricoides]|uniref:PIG-L domain-containing protein n=1 Tax=Marivirga lumbricoides TaxID=1046115 RepID=A0ABQ1N3A0_9BACT|nr:PIG-L domain-containing protein [Marivirga lumbricoides]
MITRLLKASLVLLFSLISVSLSKGQYEQEYSSSDILHELQKLQNTTRVLYIAAHPDDENTRLISYLANGKKFETAYLSLTRGDGGQNVIGPELSEALGLIRTQELLAARRTDGGNQFFTRANDFGYSKNPSETFNKWDKQAVLSDVVWVIRNFQPDVIITRFNETPGTTHGHHTASAILAREAFTKAADPKVFPEQLQYVEAWKTKKLYWNTSSWFFSLDKEFSEEKYSKVNVGEYNPVLGSSYTEIAAKSRSQHKSQAFGSSGQRGKEIEYLEQWEGSPQNSALFEGISTGWGNYKNGKQIASIVNEAIADYNPLQPSKTIPQLIQLKKLLKQLPQSAVKSNKLSQVDQLILESSGFYNLLYSENNYAAPGDSVLINLEIVNRSDVDIQLEKVIIPKVSFQQKFETKLLNDEVINKQIVVKIASDQSYSNPYWLNEDEVNGLYKVNDQQKIGQPENAAAIHAQITLLVNGEKVELNSPLVHKSNDRIKGEVIQPFYILPEASISFSDEVFIFTEQSQVKEIGVSVKALKNNVSGKLEIKIPTGWELINDNSLRFNSLDKDQTRNFKIKVRSGTETGKFSINAALVLDNGITINKKVQKISYDHIPDQVIIREAQSKVVLADVKIKGQLIGYIEGAGDAVDEALKTMGYSVEYIDIAAVSVSDLEKYDAIVAGIRAYNTNEALQNNYSKLLAYTKAGGTYVVQYNTSYSLPDKEFWPYPLQISRDRITVEEAKMDFLAPKHQVLNYPNDIKAEDFEGWVQERGLYFPGNWDEQYQPILSGADPGDDTFNGALLVADYGKGKFVYTGISFFRELPEGVAGAYRLFANLVAPVGVK